MLEGEKGGLNDGSWAILLADAFGAVWIVLHIHGHENSELPAKPVGNADADTTLTSSPHFNAQGSKQCRVPSVPRDF